MGKRYVPESGSSTVDAIWRFIPASQMIASLIVYVETISVLVRRQNAGHLTPTTYRAGRSALRKDLLEDSNFTILVPEFAHYLAAANLIPIHNINASDAIVLDLYTRHAAGLDLSQLPAVLIACDERLLRAAAAEGMKTINPEAIAVVDVPAFLA